MNASARLELALEVSVNIADQQVRHLPPLSDIKDINMQLELAR